MYKLLDIKARIIDETKKSNLSINKMLLQSRVNPNTVSRMESRQTMPSAEVLARIADTLNVSLDYLMGRTDNPEVNK